MRPMRTSRSSWMPSIGSAATAMAIALVVGSVLATFSGLRDWLLLSPVGVTKHFALWQFITYAFIEVSPFGVIIGALIIWSMGGALEQTFGRRRFLVFSLGVLVTTGVFSVLAMIAYQRPEVGFHGGGALTTLLWVALGLSYGKAQTNFWGLPITGNVLALIGVGFVVLNGLMGSWIYEVPSLIAIAVTGIYMRAGSPRLLWLKFTSWRLHRQMRSRSKHLKLIGKDRNTTSGSDRYLH